MLALLALIALAPPLADDKTYQDGVRLLDEFEYEAAVAKLKEAAADTTRSPVDRATVLVYLGVAHAELRDETQALKSFEEAVALHPLVVTPSSASPKIRDLLDRARQNVASRAPVAPVAVAAPVAAATPPPATTTAPRPATTTTTKPAPKPSEPAGEGGGVGPVLLWTGVAGLAAGVVVGIAGVAALAGGGGLVLYALSPLVPYQDDAYELVNYGFYSAIAGGGLLAIGVVALAAGGGVAGASFVVE